MSVFRCLWALSFLDFGVSGFRKFRGFRVQDLGLLSFIGV